MSSDVGAALIGIIPTLLALAIVAIVLVANRQQLLLHQLALAKEHDRLVGHDRERP